MVNEAQLVYIHKPLPFVAGFTLPIFEHNRQFYIQNIKEDIIYGFDQVEFDDHVTLDSLNIGLSARVGGNACVSFLTSELQHIVGTRDNVISKLMDSIHKYTNPYVLLEIGEFMEDREIMRQALEGIQRLSLVTDPLSDLLAKEIQPAVAVEKGAPVETSAEPSNLDEILRTLIARSAGGFADQRSSTASSTAKMSVGEALVGDGNEVAHIDLLIGPRGSAVEYAFANGLVNNKDGFTTLLAVIAPNLLVKPYTMMFNKVTIKNAKQAVQMFGPAQYGVAKAVADSVAEGVIPVSMADDMFICVGVFIHWEANDDQKIQDFNYAATKEAIRRALKGEPTPSNVLLARVAAKHPFAAH
jgi:5,6,7,8-tetrahydromethanopterin hydro-lyase